MNIGDRIKNRRIELKLSVDEVAERLGKNRATVYRYENNDIENLPTTVLEPLAEILETTPAYLMGWEDDDVRLIHDSAFSLASIYEVFGYELYTLCDSYLSLLEKENKEQLLSFASFLLKRERGKDFEMPTEEEVLNYINTEKVSKILDADFHNSYGWANAAHTRTDIAVTDADVQNDEDIMDDENF